MNRLIANLSELDRRATLEAGISPKTLMENAGQAVAKVIQQENPGKFQSGVILCGPGNNGGDGFVVARLLLEAGYQSITVVYWAGKTYSREAMENLEALMTRPIQVVNLKNQSELAMKALLQSDFAVDALFGSGLSRPIEGEVAILIEEVNRLRDTKNNASASGQGQHYPVFAVDVPSGINSATGQVLGIAIQADRTITLAAAKPGLFLYPGKTLAGTVDIVSIGLPQAMIEEDDSDLRLLDRLLATHWLPKRPDDGHKFRFGHILVIAGSHKMPGAAILCSESAMSAGAGLVTLASPESVFSQCPLMPEVMRHFLPADTDSRHLTPAGANTLLELLQAKKFDTVLIGPGLGREPETLNAINQLLQALSAHYGNPDPNPIPVIVDADGLYALAQNPMVLSKQFTLTPHVGECARLLNVGSPEIEADLATAARQARTTFQCNIVLKSGATLAAHCPSNHKNDDDNSPCVWISPWGNSGMATAGSGDVLGGIIAAMAAQLHAQTGDTTLAALLGVTLHGLAGDAAANDLTPYAMRASDIYRALPQAFRALMAKADLPSSP